MLYITYFCLIHGRYKLHCVRRVEKNDPYFQLPLTNRNSSSVAFLYIGTIGSSQ